MSSQICNLTLDQFIKQIKTDLITTEYFVGEMDKNNHHLELNIAHKPDFFCLVVMEDGTCNYTVNDTKSKITKGDILLCPSYETFTIDHISDDYKAKFILFTTDYLLKTGFNYRSNDILKSFSSNPFFTITGQSELLSRVKFYISNMESLNDNDSQIYYRHELIWHTFSLLIYELDNHFKSIEVAPPTSPRREDLTAKFFLLLRENFKVHHEVQFYADSLFITRKYLSKMIKKTMLKSPREIINHVLVNEAKVLLRNHQTSVSEAAIELNFSDQSVFSKFFKKHTGQTPSEFKKNVLF